MELSQQILVRLPRSPRTDGRSGVTPVHSFTAGRKRKRNEVCAAIDGESINIYDVRNARLKASYPVSPTSTFASNPCSVCLRDGEQPRRRTYIITNQPGAQIQCFSHSLQSSQEYDTKSASIPEGFLVDDIVCFDAIPSAAQASTPQSDLDILVVNKQGQALVCQSDLSSDVTLVDLSLPFGNSVVFIATQSHGEGQAVPGPLKHRPDLLATAGEGDSILTALVVPQAATEGSAPEVHVHTWLLSKDELLRKGSLGRKVRLLSTSTLHLPAQWLLPDSRSGSLGQGGDSLILWNKQEFLRYDLTLLSPQPVTKLTTDSGEINSAFELPGNIIALSTIYDISFYDMKYGSLQACLRNEKSAIQLAFVTYHARLRKIVCIRSHSVLTIKINPTQSLGRPARTHFHALLSDSIGRGIASHSAISGSVPPSKKIKIGSLKQSPLRDGHAQFQAEKVGGIQVDDIPNRDPSTTTSKTIRQKSTNSVHEGPGSRTDEEIGEMLQRSILWQQTDSKNELLKIEGVSEKQIHSWIRDGLFLRRRLSGKGRQGGASFSTVPAPGKLAMALMRFDSTLATLKDYITLCVRCDREEFVATLKILLLTLISRTEFTDMTHLKEHGEVNHDVEMNQDGIPNENQALVTEGNTARSEPEEDETVLGTASETLRDHLVYAVAQLARFSHRTISTLLRSSFTSDEVLALIQLLRQDLYESGYSHITQNDEARRSLPGENAVMEPLPSSPIRRLGIEDVAKILSTSIEALGIVSLTVKGESDQFVESIIPELRSEIGRAIKTLDDLLALQNTLQENVRFAESLRGTAGQSQHRDLSTRDQTLVQKPGSITTIYKELTGEHGEVEASSGILPLSLKGDEVSLFKKQQNGNAASRRSKRELQVLRSRKVPQYSVDRLVL